MSHSPVIAGATPIYLFTLVASDVTDRITVYFLMVSVVVCHVSFVLFL